MNIRFLDDDLETWLKPRETPPRSEGRHVSDVVLEMLKRISRRYELLEKRPGGHQPVYEPGYLWEDVLSRTLSARLAIAPHEVPVVPMELHRDGIFGTPDRPLFDRTGDRWIVEESKCTWMTSRGLDEDPKALFNNPKFSYWFCQVKTYAAMIAGYSVGQAGGAVESEYYAIPPRRAAYAPPAHPPLIRIRALHLNGPYGWSKDYPKPLAWEIEHTAAELETWWASILRFERNRREGAPDGTDALDAPDADGRGGDPTRN